MSVAALYGARRGVPGDRYSILEQRVPPLVRGLREFSEPRSTGGPLEFDRMANEGYALCSAVRACVEEIASSAAEPEFIVERYAGRQRWERVDPMRNDDAAGRALAKLMWCPCGSAGQGTMRPMSRYEFFYRFISDRFIYGNAMVEIVNGTVSGQPVRLAPLDVQRIQPDRTDPTDDVKRVVLNRYNTRSLVTPGTGTVTIAVQDLLHWRAYNPNDSFWGLSPIVSILNEVDLDAQSMLYLRTFFYNKAEPGGMLSLKGITKPEQRRALQNDMRAGYAGANRFKVMVVDQDGKWTETGTRPDRLKLDHIFNLTESRVCAVYHVPAIIIGFQIGLLRSTFSNYREARVSFWRETLRPMYVEMGQLLTNMVASRFGEEYRIVADFSQVEDLQESEETKRKWALDGFEKGLHTLNEARAIVGEKPEANGDWRKTKSADGQPAKVGEYPDPNPKPLPVPGTPPTPRRSTTPGKAAAESPAPGLQLVAGE